MTIRTVARRTALAVASLGVAATGVIATSTPADAALSDCKSGEFCIFQYSNGSGLYARFKEGTDNLGSSKVFGGKMDNVTSYVWNRSSVPWCVHQYKDQGGHSMMVRSGTKGSMLVKDPRDGFTWDNRVSSLRPAYKIVPPRNPGASYYDCLGDQIVY